MLGVSCSSSSLEMSCTGTMEGSFLKNDAFLVTVRSAFWAVTMLPFLSFTSSGSGLKGLHILFYLGCFSNSLSLRSVFLVWLHLSAYSSISVFLLASVCLTSAGA